MAETTQEKKPKRRFDTPYRIRHRDRVMEYKRNYDLRIRKAVFDFYGNKCACIGCTETNSDFLTIDHVNSDGSADVNGSGRRLTGVNLYIKVIKEGFPDTYQILCYNCNCGRQYNRTKKGTCPHLL